MGVSLIKKEEVFVDEKRVFKDQLTDFINKVYLKYNENEVGLIELIYSYIQPVLDKYGLFLVFKGGNVLRLVNNNLMKYFPPTVDKKIEEVFMPFLKQSDNDFTVYIPPYENFDEKWIEIMSRDENVSSS